MAAFARSGNGGVIGIARHAPLNGFTVSLARRDKLPTVYPYCYYPVDGGLISYGPNTYYPSSQLWGNCGTGRHRLDGRTAAAWLRLPALYQYPTQVKSGGLMAYDANISDLHKSAALYVDKILKGAKPSRPPYPTADEPDFRHQPQSRQRALDESYLNPLSPELMR